MTVKLKVSTYYFLLSPAAAKEGEAPVPTFEGKAGLNNFEI